MVLVRISPLNGWCRVVALQLKDRVAREILQCNPASRDIWDWETIARAVRKGRAVEMGRRHGVNL
jgi:hypothetical protein